MKALNDLDNKVTVLKERGNLHYKKKQYKDAIKVFSEGYNAYSQSEGDKSDESFEGVKTKITQILTNRALSYHQLNQQASVIVDATIVLD